MTDTTRFQAHYESNRIRSATDLARVQQRVRSDDGHTSGRNSPLRTLLLLGLIAALTAYLVTAEDDRGESALVRAVSELTE